MPCTKSNLLRLRSFDKILSLPSNPLIQALKCHFKSESTCSVFQENTTFTILMGNERLVIPQMNGTCFVCATSLFVKNCSVIEEYMKGIARMMYDNVYTFNNSVMYLDAYDIPGPGLKYFEVKEPNTWYRICFITQNIDQINLSEWQNKKEVFNFPFKTKVVTCLPKFIHYEPVEEIVLPDQYAKSTGTVQKQLCLNYPNFLLQDILNSYRGSIDHLGLLIEYPFSFGFDGMGNSTKRFVALSINGNYPKKVLHIRIPYDRYTEYNFVPVTRWSQVYYEKQTDCTIPRVILSSTTIGYVYKNAFFCLSHPMLGNGPTYSNVNTSFLCNAVTNFDLSREQDISVLETYRYDCKHALHKVKHKEIPYELWCLSRNEESKLYSKYTKLPHLTEHWIDFFIRNCNKSSIDFTNLDVLKLALVLSKHNICYKTKISQVRSVDIDQECLMFRLDAKAIEFLNEMRLNIQDPDTLKLLENEESTCNII
ncbi:uncharacterized protein TNIN_179611 [Trichonephila inaurata madagascariensis]|uniref:Uncharacterized protein n=1 Tax=Trichonephila inaurata madagascariensis TaxID=2747483 RepID=A0A8X6Y9Z4_9ARAC|nr:uncharacterized protein TNIN_179611 [Trichonephila inaurata madagascariensis]